MQVEQGTDAATFILSQQGQSIPSWEVPWSCGQGADWEAGTDPIRNGKAAASTDKNRVTLPIDPR